MHTIYHFEAWEVRNLVLQMLHDLDLKRRSYGRFKTDGAECENFAQALFTRPNAKLDCFKW